MAASGGGCCLLRVCAEVIDCISARDGAPMGGLGMQAAFCRSISLTFPLSARVGVQQSSLIWGSC